MMCICHARKFETLVRLRRGADPRTVRIVLATRLDEPDRLAPRRVVDAFFQAVDVGLFGPSKITDRLSRTEVVRSYGVMSDIFEATFLRAPPGMFAPLARMAAVSVPGVVRFELRELNRDERTLLVTGFDPEEEATILDVEWQIDFGSTDATSLRVCFEDEPTVEVQKRLGEVLRAWAELVELGAWSPSGDPPAEAALTLLMPRGVELVAEFASLACGYGAFEALFAALNELHEQQAIRKVVIPYRVDVRGDRPRARSDRLLPSPSCHVPPADAHG